MNRSTGISIGLACLALAGGIAVMLSRAAPEAQRPAVGRIPSVATPDPNALRPLVPPGATVVAEPEPGAKSDRRLALDRLLNALRGGNRAIITKALAELYQTLIPPPIPDEKNAALIYRKAFEKYCGPTEEEMEVLSLLEKESLLTGEHRQVLKKWLEKNREALSSLTQASELPECRFRLNYDWNSDGDFAYLLHLQAAAQLVRAAAMIDAPEQASAHHKIALHLADALADDPSLVSQSTRWALHDQSFSVLRESLGPEMGAEDLESIISKLHTVNVREACETSFLYDLYVCVQGVMEDPTPDTLSALTGKEDPQGPMLKPHILRHFAETMVEYASLTSRPYYEVKADLERFDRTGIEKAPWYAKGLRETIPPITLVSRQLAETEAQVGGSMIAAAIVLHRLKEGKYPADMGDLSAIAADVPIDPFTGRPFIYRREGVGFVVYSVGPDGSDGGSYGDDIVFRKVR